MIFQRKLCSNILTLERLIFFQEYLVFYSLHSCGSKSVSFLRHLLGHAQIPGILWKFLNKYFLSFLKPFDDFT